MRDWTREAETLVMAWTRRWIVSMGRTPGRDLEARLAAFAADVERATRADASEAQRLAAAYERFDRLGDRPDGEQRDEQGTVDEAAAALDAALAAYRQARGEP